MTTIDRTAYPRPGDLLTSEELRARYTLTEADKAFLNLIALTSAGRLTVAVMLKVREDLGCFPAMAEVHGATIGYLAAQIGRSAPVRPLGEVSRPTLHRYRSAIRARLSVLPFDDAGERLVAEVVRGAAETISDPALLIDQVLAVLREASIDLPAFRTLDRLVDQLCDKLHQKLSARIAARLDHGDAEALEALLAVPRGGSSAPFDRLRQEPGPAPLGSIKAWEERFEWLDSLPETDRLLSDIAPARLRHLAAEAAALQTDQLLGMAQPGRRALLLLSLLRQARLRCRDELTEMLLRHVRHIRASAKAKLETLGERHRELEEALLGIFGQVLDTAKRDKDDAVLGRRVRRLLAEKGGIEALTQQCEAGSAWHGDNDLPLLWPIHIKYRGLLFRLVDLLDPRPAVPDRRLADALAVVLRHRETRRRDVPDQLDLGFASRRWAAFVLGQDGVPSVFERDAVPSVLDRDAVPSVLDRRALEVCVFVHLAEALRSGDFYVEGSENFADYRAQLPPEGPSSFAAYCDALGLTLPRASAAVLNLLGGRAVPGEAIFPDQAIEHDAEEGADLESQRPAPAFGLPPASDPRMARALRRHVLCLLGSVNPEASTGNRGKNGRM